jgi:hypothetical protein
LKIKNVDIDFYLVLISTYTVFKKYRNHILLHTEGKAIQVILETQMLLKFSTNNSGQKMSLPMSVSMDMDTDRDTWTWTLTRADHVAEVLHQQWRTKDVHVHMSLSMSVSMDTDMERDTWTWTQADFSS